MAEDLIISTPEDFIRWDMSALLEKLTDAVSFVEAGPSDPHEVARAALAVIGADIDRILRESTH